MNTTGGAVVMGSFPHPPNGIVELDYEYILLFKKPGQMRRVPPERKAASRLTTEEWKQFFSGHWQFGGARQALHEAMFPDELPRRLIRMFSFAGETVLDPFLGSGTTAKVALELGRSALGYEVQPNFLPLIRERLCADSPQLLGGPIRIEQRSAPVEPVHPPAGYVPHIQDAQAVQDPKRFRDGQEPPSKVTEIVDATTLRLDDGRLVSLFGIEVPESGAEAAVGYLKKYVQGKQVLIKTDGVPSADVETLLPVYLYLANKLFINRKMLEMGLASADRCRPHRLRERFLRAEAEASH
jgi:hypothetical protein